MAVHRMTTLPSLPPRHIVPAPLFGAKSMKTRLAEEKNRLQAAKEREAAKILDVKTFKVGELNLSGRDMLKLIGETWFPCTCCKLPEALSTPDSSMYESAVQRGLAPLITAGYLKARKRPGFSIRKGMEEMRWSIFEGIREMFFVHNTVRLTEKGRQAAATEPEVVESAPPDPKPVAPPMLAPLDSDATNYPS